MFDDWLMAVGFPDVEANAQRKAALLRASLGPEGFKVYCSLAVDTREPYNAAVARLQSHFGQPASTIFARAQFTRYQQRQGVTVSQYVATLRELASKCDFPAAQLEERVRDQFVAWCASDKIRERLLQEPANRTLDEVVTLATTIERALFEAPALTSSSSSVVSQVKDRSASSNRKSSSSSTGVTCWNCGTAGHTSKSTACPARGKECRNCAGIGHFASACRKKSASGSGQPSRTRSSSRYRGRRGRGANQIGVVLDDTDDQPTVPDDTQAGMVICSVKTSPAGIFKQVSCKVGGEQINLILDLGAKVSIIEQMFYDRFLRTKFPLRSTVITLHTYNGEPIPCRGCFTAPVQVEDKHLRDACFFVTEQGQSLMGVDLFDALGGTVSIGSTKFISHPSSVNTVFSVGSISSSVSLDEYPALLKASGTLRGFVHKPRVDLAVRPVQQKFWHPPLAMRAPIEAELRRMEAAGVLERIDSSPWTSNILATRKKDGTVRVCANLTAVNKALIPERFPLPTMDELTARLAGSTVFSKIDLLWGYLQLPLASELRYLTAVVTHIGVFQWTSVPFGISTGPSAFQTVIHTIIEGIEGCVNILDDILVHGRSMEEHDDRLRRLLERLVKYNATVRRDKCIIGQPEVEFNGHRVSASGVLPLQSNVDVIIGMPVPKNQKQLLRFLCTATYYMKFVSGFAALCEPLRQLLKSDAVWNWTETCDQCFRNLKHRLASPPVLAHFDTTAETVVTCDASATALGACLSQWVDGVEKPVAFASRALSPAERNYSASEREALSCLWACERWHFYLYGRRFKLITDHEALKTLLTTGGTGHRPLRLHRWADRLYQYLFDVQYRPGRNNVVADCLSRIWEDGPEVTSTVPQASDSDADDLQLIQTIFGQFATSVVKLQAVADATEQDDVLSTVKRHVIVGWPPSKSALRPELWPYYAVRDDLSVAVNGHVLTRDCRTVIPASLRDAVLQLAHEGHPGIVRMKSRCRESVWWPGIDSQLENFVHECMPCTHSGKSVRPVPGPLQPVQLPSGPWRKISLDIAGEFNVAPDHQRYIVAAIDYYSKWPEAAACGTVTSATLIQFLTAIFDRFGLVDEVVTDNGPQMTSLEFRQFLERHGVRHSTSALYAPQSNAEIERFNRVIKEGISTAMADGQSFLTGLRQTLAAYRSTKHAVTGVSPASLMLAFQFKTPLTALQTQRSSSTLSNQAISPTAVKRRVQFKQAEMADRHNARFHAVQPTFKPGDWVRIKLPTRPHKLAPVFSEPYEVVKAAGNTIWLRDGRRWNVRRCIRYRSSLKAAPTVPPTAPSVRDTEVQPSCFDDDEPDSATFAFPVDGPRAAAQGQGLGGPRRSTRIRHPRDFGPVIRH